MRSKNIMCDLETLGLANDAIILSIGMVVFDNNGVIATYYAKLDVEEQRTLGRTTTQSTLDFWEKQTPEARSVLDPNQPTVSVTEALNAIDALFHSYPEAYIWGNDTLFDVGKLTSLYTSACREAPWKYWSPRCYRTLYNSLRNSFEGRYGVMADEAPRVGTYHNALDDALTQTHRLLKAHEDLGLEFM